MSLESELARWSKTPAGKAKLKEAALGHGGSGSNYSGSRLPAGGGGNRPPSFYAEEFIRILSNKMSLAGFEYGDYLYWTDIGYDEATGQYEIHVNFKPKEVERPSLFPGDKKTKKGYPDGIGNIAALMNTGYSAKNYVYGTMPDGRRGRSLISREGSWFMQAAVKEFMQMYGAGITVEVDDVFGPEL